MPIQPPRQSLLKNKFSSCFFHTTWMVRKVTGEEERSIGWRRRTPVSSSLTSKTSDSLAADNNALGRFVSVLILLNFISVPTDTPGISNHNMHAYCRHASFQSAAEETDRSPGPRRRNSTLAGCKFPSLAPQLRPCRVLAVVPSLFAITKQSRARPGVNCDFRKQLCGDCWR
jgi:hypothetical protein